MAAAVWEQQNAALRTPCPATWPSRMATAWAGAWQAGGVQLQARARTAARKCLCSHAPNVRQIANRVAKRRQTKGVSGHPHRVDIESPQAVLRVIKNKC